MPTETAVDLDFFGSRVRVETGDLALATEIRRLWAPFLTASAIGPIEIDIDVTGEPEVPEVTERLERINTTLNATAMELTPHLAIHAGVVARGERVVAFPAESGTGKSTLTAACVRRGFDYVSDEGLCLGYDDGQVWPYPRPLGLSPWTAAVLGIRQSSDGTELFVTARDLGGEMAGPAPLTLTAVVLLDRVNGARPTLAPVRRAEGIEALLTMSFNHYRRPADALRLVTAVVAGASVRRLTYDDPGAAADLLSLLLVDETPDP